MTDVPLQPGAGLAPIQLSARYVLFYGMFALLVAVYFGTVTATQRDWVDIMNFSLGLLAFAAPLVPTDFGSVGGLVPAVLGGIIAALARPKGSDRHFMAALLLSGLIYILYFHAELFYKLDENGEVSAAIQESWVELSVSGTSTGRDIGEFAVSVKSLASYMFATLIGLHITGSPAVDQAAPQPKSEADPYLASTRNAHPPAFSDESDAAAIATPTPLSEPKG